MVIIKKSPDIIDYFMCYSEITLKIEKIITRNERSLTEAVIDEAALVERLKAGDNRAIDEIMNLYKQPLYAFILRFIDDRDTADDVFQETWIRVIKSIKSFRGDSKFSTWLFQIAVNMSRDYLRKIKRQKYVPLEEAEYLSCDPSVDPIKIIEGEQVHRIVSELPDKMKEAVILRYFHDLNDDEIAEILGCPVGTVKSRIHRASEILRKKWETYKNSYSRKKYDYESI